MREWALKLDGVEPARAVPDGELPEEAVLALADRVRRWHEAQRPADVRLEVEPGVELERRWIPLDRVGIYVPRGLVSTLVMCAVPAQAAGVELVIARRPDGAGLVARAAELLGSARCGRSAARRRSASSRTSSASTRSSGRAGRT